MLAFVSQSIRSHEEKPKSMSKYDIFMEVLNKMDVSLDNLTFFD